MTTLNPRPGAAAPGRGFGALAERHGRVLRLLGRRLVQIPVVLLVVSALTFWLIQVVPGDPGRATLGQYATDEQVRIWDEQNGLTGSLLSRYLHWLHGFVTGDWGTSFVFGQPNRELILDRLLNSALLGALAFVLLVPISVVLGSVQGYREGRRTDRSITIAAMSLSAVPAFVVGVILLLVFAVWLHLVPVQASALATGNIGQRLHAMIIPAVTLVVYYLAVVTRMVRTGVTGAITAQHHRTAVLKGLEPASIVRRHVLRNALIPTLSLLGIYLGALLSGEAVVEQLFNYPGLGALLVTAAEHKDVVLLCDGVVVTGVVALLALLLADIALIVSDPRIRFDNASS
ncbi:ABC transporter permease [Nocardioides sp. CER19]|uniref:ABC transporter permease n=1 Tax=Nocardioides sp. CER19 TaxID=3038538 RepID=UPI00244BA125|nr:ABC transporter permease [Nocardioides sp. CER19]MDH2416297.1 ABC transporter permease [Nocardioides sp. CER19]